MTQQTAPSAQPQPPRWFRRHPKKALVLFTLTLVLLMLFGFEVFLRLRAPSHPPGKIPNSARYIRLKEHKPLMDVTDTPTDEYLAGTDSLVKKPYRFRADQHAFIMPSMVHEQADATIVFLGGSTTECIYVTEDVRFPYLAGRLIEHKTLKKINSCNGGVSGNHSLHSIDILLNKVLALQPQAVVMMHNVNDLVTLLYMDTYWNDNFSRSLICSGLPADESRPFGQKLRCMGYDFCDAVFPAITKEVQTISIKSAGGWDEWSQVRGKKIVYDEGRLAEQFQANLRTFIAVCRIHRVTPVLMTMASRFTDHPDPLVLQDLSKLFGTSVTYAQFKSGFDRFNQVIRETGQAENVQVIDLAAQIPQDRKYLYDPLHLNDEGSKLAAGIVAEGLKSLVANPAAAPASMPN